VVSGQFEEIGSSSTTFDQYRFCQRALRWAAVRAPRIGGQPPRRRATPVHPSGRFATARTCPRSAGRPVGEKSARRRLKNTPLRPAHRGAVFQSINRAPRMARCRCGLRLRRWGVLGIGDRRGRPCSAAGSEQSGKAGRWRRKPGRRCGVIESESRDVAQITNNSHWSPLGEVTQRPVARIRRCPGRS
jgi:hypothetical protein